MPGIDLTELATRESEQVEWKENVADIDGVVEALCAFANDLANLGGGYVVCGAREIADEHGFPRMIRAGLTAARLKEVEGRVLARCRERVAPPLTPLVTELPADTDDRRVLVFTQPATAAAHTFRRDREGAKHFVRVGRSTIEARNGVLLNLLVRKGATEPWDRRVCASATERDLDLLALRDALNQMKVAVPEGRLEQFLSEEVLLSPFIPTLCVRENLTNILRPRNFAMLLFGREVQRFIPGAVSLFSVYPGTDRSDRHAERYEIAGTAIEQARQLRQLLSAQVSTAFDKEDMVTPNAAKYPNRALYEAMGNALAHRDYERFDPVRITAFADRIEVLSPGPLPPGVDLDAFRRGRAPPRWRNQALAWFFNRLLLAQAEGQGITTILRTMQEEGCPPPMLNADSESVICVLPAHPRHVRLYRLQQLQMAEQFIAGGAVRQAQSIVLKMLDQHPLDSRALQLFAQVQRNVHDPLPLFEFVSANLDAVLAMRPAVLVSVSETLCGVANTPSSNRQLARRLLSVVSRSDLRREELPRIGRAFVDARDADGLKRLVACQVERHPDWDSSEEIMRLRREADALAAHPPNDDLPRAGN